MTGGTAPQPATDSEVLMFRSSLVALATLAVTVVPAAAAHADQYDSQVRIQMVASAMGAVADGFSMRVPLEIGSLRQGQYQTYTLTMDGNLRYRLVANCDNDCSDIDISVTEPDGREIAWDRRNGDLAVVDVSGHPGRHTVRVSMASCRLGPCRFGLGVFGR